MITAGCFQTQARMLGCRLLQGVAEDRDLLVILQPPLLGRRVGVCDRGQSSLSDLPGDNPARSARSGLVRRHSDFCCNEVGVGILPDPGQQALGCVLEPGLQRSGGQAGNAQHAQQGLDESAAGVVGDESDNPDHQSDADDRGGDLNSQRPQDDQGGVQVLTSLYGLIKVEGSWPRMSSSYQRRSCWYR